MKNECTLGGRKFNFTLESSKVKQKILRAHCKNEDAEVML